MDHRANTHAHCHTSVDLHREMSILLRQLEVLVYRHVYIHVYRTNWKIACRYLSAQVMKGRQQVFLEVCDVCNVFLKLCDVRAGVTEVRLCG